MKLTKCPTRDKEISVTHGGMVTKTKRDITKSGAVVTANRGAATPNGRIQMTKNGGVRRKRINGGGEQMIGLARSGGCLNGTHWVDGNFTAHDFQLPVCRHQSTQCLICQTFL